MEENLSQIGLVLRYFLRWLLVGVVILTLDYIGWTGWLRGPVEKGVGDSAAAAGRGLETASLPYKTVNYWWRGAKRVAELEQRLASMAVDKARLVVLEKENRALREAAGVKGIMEAEGWTGWLVQGSNGGLLGLGVRDGIEQGMIVIDGGAVLVGRVAELGNRVSKVVRPIDRGARVGVRVVGKTTTGAVEGDGVAARLVDVLQAEDLVKGDILVTSGADEVYPDGVVVGEVVEVVGNPADVTKGGRVEWLAEREGMVRVY